MGLRRAGFVRVGFRRVGQTSGGGGGGAVSSVTGGSGILAAPTTGAVIVSAIYGGAPPAVASASAAGTANSVAHSDHTHALDVVAYQPSLLAMKASGVIQQTYSAPTATPSVLAVAAKAILYGNIAGAGTITQDTGGLVYDNTFFPRQAIGVGAPFGGLFGPGSLGVGLDISSPGPGQLTALSLQGSVGGVSSGGVQLALMGGLRGGASGRPEWQIGAIVGDDGAVSAYEGHVDIYANKSGTQGTFSTNGQVLAGEFYAGTTGVGYFVAVGGIAIGSGVHGAVRGLYPIDSGVGLIIAGDSGSSVSPTGAGVPNNAKIRYNDTGSGVLEVSYKGLPYQALGGGLTAFPRAGTNLGDADTTINPATSAASEFTIPVSTLTATRTLTLGVGGSPVTGLMVQIVRRDLSGNPYVVKDDGGTTLYTFAGSPTTAQAITCSYNGSHFVFISAFYVAT